MSLRNYDEKLSHDEFADKVGNLPNFGSLAGCNRMANVPKFATPADPAYVQADQQALIDRLNQLLAELQRQGIMAPEK